jgi:prophage regulatory protein
MRTLRFQDVLLLTGLSRSTIWRLERKGGFPKRIRLGQNSIGWAEAEILAWLSSRPRGFASGQHD